MPFLQTLLQLIFQLNGSPPRPQTEQAHFYTQIAFVSWPSTLAKSHVLPNASASLKVQWGLAGPQKEKVE